MPGIGPEGLAQPEVPDAAQVAVARLVRVAEGIDIRLIDPEERQGALLLVGSRMCFGAVGLSRWL